MCLCICCIDCDQLFIMSPTISVVEQLVQNPMPTLPTMQPSHLTVDSSTCSSVVRMIMSAFIQLGHLTTLNVGENSGTRVAELTSCDGRRREVFWCLSHSVGCCETKLISFSLILTSTSAETQGFISQTHLFPS